MKVQPITPYQKYNREQERSKKLAEIATKLEVSDCCPIGEEALIKVNKVWFLCGTGGGIKFLIKFCPFCGKEL